MQIQAQSEAVAAAWQLIEAQKAELASQHSKLAQQTSHLDQQTRQVFNCFLLCTIVVPESKGCGLACYPQHHNSRIMLFCVIEAATCVFQLLACVCCHLTAVAKVDSMLATGRILHCCHGVAQAAQSNLPQSVARCTLDEYVLP